jgi:hypothetical protein
MSSQVRYWSIYEFNTDMPIHSRLPSPDFYQALLLMAKQHFASRRHPFGLLKGL